MGSQRVGHDWATELNWLNPSRGASEKQSPLRLFYYLFLVVDCTSSATVLWVWTTWVLIPWKLSFRRKVIIKMTDLKCSCAVKVATSKHRWLELHYNTPKTLQKLWLMRRISHSRTPGRYWRTPMLILFPHPRSLLIVKICIVTPKLKRHKVSSLPFHIPLVLKAKR